MDLGRKIVRLTHYDARMVIPLTWDKDGVTECAFVMRTFYRGRAPGQLQIHLNGGMDFLDGSFFSDGSYSPSAPSRTDSLCCQRHKEVSIQEFAPALRTSLQSEAFRIAMQMIGDLTDFGIGYFDFDESHGYVRTATEVSPTTRCSCATFAGTRTRCRAPSPTWPGWPCTCRTGSARTKDGAGAPPKQEPALNNGAAEPVWPRFLPP